MCNWRKDLHSMAQLMEAVLDNNIPDIPHDITFVVGEEKVKISCHKLFLAIASPVFQTMFSYRHSERDNMSIKAANGFEILKSDSNPSKENTTSKHVSKEVKGDHEMVIELPDLLPCGFKNVVKYAYTGGLDVDIKDALSTMHAADKYDIKELKQHCSKLLHSEITIENVVTVCQAATLLNDKKLSKKTWQFVQANAGLIVESQQFYEFSEENLCKFLKLDCIPHLKSEADVFNAVLKWGNFQCIARGLKCTQENITMLLSKTIPLIRFPAMEPQEFTEFVLPSGILNADECIELYKYFTTRPALLGAISRTMKYSCKNRTLIVATFCSAGLNEKLPIHNSWGSTYDSFTVTGTKKKIKLKGVGIVLPLNSPTDFQIRISVYDGSSGIYTDTSAQSLVQVNDNMHYIELDNAVSIRSKMQYQVYVNYDRNGGSSPNDVTRVVGYFNELMNSKTITLKTTDEENMTLTLSPKYYVIWSLNFQC